MYFQKSDYAVAVYDDFFPARYVVIDLETTGYSPKDDKIIEIGAILVENGQIKTQFQSFVNPECCVPDHITRLTGITDEMVSNAPAIRDILRKLINFIDFDPIIAHNAKFEGRWLTEMFNRYMEINLNNSFIDTLSLSRRIFPALESHSLETLTDLLSIPAAVHHRAVEDAIQTMQLFEFFRGYCSLHNHSCDSSQIKTPKTIRMPKPKFEVSAKDVMTTIDASCTINELNPFFGRTFVITGDLPMMLRRDAYERIIRCGGFIEDRVTKKVNCIVIGSSIQHLKNPEYKSTKQRKAEEYIAKGADIQIMSGSEFTEIMRSLDGDEEKCPEN